MENNANYALVGVIATAIGAALFGFVFWFAGPSTNAPVNVYDVVFNGTVSGIGRGTDVQFNGIKVGQVRDVSLDPTDTNQVVARISVDQGTPVKADTRVLMGFQGLTGVGSLQLSGGTKDAGPPVAGPGHDVPTLYAEVSDFQSILDGLSSTINGTSTAVNRLNGFLDANNDKLDHTITNVETFSSALASNADGIENFMASISDAGRQIGPLAEELKGLSTDMRDVVNAIPPDKVAQVVTDVAGFTDSLSRNSAKVDDFFASATEVSNGLKSASANLNKSIDVVNKVTAQIDPETVGRVLGNVDVATTNLTAISSDLKGVMAAVPPQQVEQIVADIGVFSDSLARNSGQIDTFFTATGDLSETIGGLVKSLSTSVGVLNQVAAEIDPQAIGRVITNVDSFSQKLGNNSDNVDTIVSNVTNASNKLSGSIDKVNEILAKVNTTVSSPDGQDMFGEISAAAKSIRILADQLNTSTANLAAGLTSFTSRGLPNYTALGEEARATLQRLDRVVRNLENNPQGLIFGGETVRDYNKR